jgi:predicted Zn-dependent protease
MNSAADSTVRRALIAAEGYLELGMPSHALEQLRLVRDPQPVEFAFHLLRAEVHRAQEQWQLALEDFQRCHAADPTNISVLLGLAWCYKRVDQLPQAIAAMHAAHQAHAKEPIILYNLACYYSLARNKPQALTWLGRALRMNGDLASLISEESDFDPLRHDPDFRKLLELAARRDPRSAAS